MKAKNNKEEIFIIKVTNRKGEVGFISEREEGLMISFHMDLSVTLFYTWQAANRFVKKNNLRKSMKNVLIMKSAEMAEFGAKDGTVSPAKEDYYFLTGETADGEQVWLHFDNKTKEYYPRNQKLGACGWFQWQVKPKIEEMERNNKTGIKWRGEKTVLDNEV